VLEELRIDIERMPFATPSTQIEIVDLSQQDFSTAVVSQGLKLAGKGRRVLVVQLLKGGIAQGSDRPMHLAQNLDWIRCNLYRQITAADLDELELASVQQLWQHLRSSSDSGQYDALIVEDLGRAIDLGAIDLAEAIDWLNRVPSEVSILLAGKNHPPEFQDIDRASAI
jgi:cob(I)alamin adenosyltransferase